MKYLEELKKLNAKFIVPGHGAVGNNQQIDILIKYIKTLGGLVDNAIKNNLTEDELKSTPIPDEFKTWWLSSFFTPNLIIQYKMKTGTLQE